MPNFMTIGQIVADIIIAICVFFKMAAATSFSFKSLKLLTVRTVKKIALCHNTNFRRNRSNRGRDMAIF